MKKTHIIALAIVGIAIAMIVIGYGDTSIYTTFPSAQKYAKEGNKQDVHIVGSLKKDAQGNFTKELDKEKINVLVLVDDSDSLKMSKEELANKLSSVIESVAKEVDKKVKER